MCTYASNAVFYLQNQNSSKLICIPIFIESMSPWCHYLSIFLLTFNINSFKVNNNNFFWYKGQEYVDGLVYNSSSMYYSSYIYITTLKVAVRKNCSHLFSKTFSPVLTLNTLLCVAIIFDSCSCDSGRKVLLLQYQNVYSGQ